MCSEREGPKLMIGKGYYAARWIAAYGVYAADKIHTSLLDEFYEAFKIYANNRIHGHYLLEEDFFGEEERYRGRLIGVAHTRQEASRKLYKHSKKRAKELQKKYGINKRDVINPSPIEFLF